VSSEGDGGHGGGSGVLWVWGRERVRQGGENDAGLLQVLGRARVGEPRCCSGPSTAAARWQPAGASGVAWQGEEVLARGKEGGVESGRDAWMPWRAGGGRGPA